MRLKSSFAEDVCAKSLFQLMANGGRIVHKVLGTAVGIIHRVAQQAKHLRNHRFATTYAARNSYYHHLIIQFTESVRIL